MRDAGYCRKVTEKLENTRPYGQRIEKLEFSLFPPKRTSPLRGLTARPRRLSLRPCANAACWCGGSPADGRDFAHYYRNAREEMIRSFPR